MTPPGNYRPRLHTAIFADVWTHDVVAKATGATPVHDAAYERTVKRHEEQKREIEALARKLGWSSERLRWFTQLVVEYRSEHSIETYLQIRREFPEVDIQVGQFSGIDPLFALEEEFKRHGIEPQLIASVLDADEGAIDALCLQLLELLVARDKLPKDGPGHIEERRNAISDATVNYLIVTMLEATDWNEREVLVPASLVVLIRHQLCGPNPDLYAAYRSKIARQNAALFIGQRLEPGEKLSINTLAAMTGIPRATAARWLADPKFQSTLELGARIRKYGNPVLKGLTKK
jgi:hypothetical protein